LGYEEDRDRAVERLSEKIAAMESPEFEKYLMEAAENEGIEVDPKALAINLKALNYVRATLEMDPTATEFEHERSDRRIRFLEIVVPHLAAGRETYTEIFAALSDEEAEEVDRLLDGGTIDELMK
jgi:hypothetical protein